jgi:hypothetical protein
MKLLLHQPSDIAEIGYYSATPAISIDLICISSTTGLKLFATCNFELVLSFRSNRAQDAVLQITAWRYSQVNLRKLIASVK